MVGKEIILPCPWDPKGGTAIGRFDNRVAVDGLFWCMITSRNVMA
jgi:hypothetical protein